MDEPVKKRVDESWKERAERERHLSESAARGAASATPSHVAAQPAGARPATPESQEARFDLFISGLTMEALVALGDMAHPTTRRQQPNLSQAKYLIDLLGIMEEKTRGNLTVEEEALVRDALYQLRMRYLAKTGG